MQGGSGSGRERGKCRSWMSRGSCGAVYKRRRIERVGACGAKVWVVRWRAACKRGRTGEAEDEGEK